MYEASSCEPCAYEDGTQVHQLDGIAEWKKKNHKSLKDQLAGKKKKNNSGNFKMEKQSGVTEFKNI